MVTLNFKARTSNPRRVKRRIFRSSWTQHALFQSPLGALAAISLGGLVILDHSLPDLVAIMKGGKVITVGCTPVIARSITLIVDDSSSMNDAQRKQLLNLKLAEMAEKGISARTLYADGMGVADNSSENLLYPVRSALALGDGVPDAVLVLSDFDVAPDTPYWATTDKSYAELRRHFLQNNTRLFLVTVAYLPSVAMPKLMAVAEQSGGREIVFKFLEDQTASCT